jgi:hypothetical protein
MEKFKTSLSLKQLMAFLQYSMLQYLQAHTSFPFTILGKTTPKYRSMVLFSPL